MKNRFFFFLSDPRRVQLAISVVVLSLMVLSVLATASPVFADPTGSGTGH